MTIVIGLTLLFASYLMIASAMQNKTIADYIKGVLV